MSAASLLLFRSLGGGTAGIGGGTSGGISRSKLFVGADSMNERKQSGTTYPYLFFLASSSDHVTPVTGVTPTVTLSKNGGSFAAAAGAVTEVGNGWYSLAGNATDRNTLGGLVVHATGTGADPFDGKVTIVPWDPFDGNLSLTGLAGLTAPAASGGLPTVDANNAVKLQSGTGANQIDLSSGRVNLGEILDVAVTDSDGTAQSATSTTLTLDAAEPTTAQYYRRQRIKIVSATTGQGQEAVITDYSTGRVATLDRTWAVTPTGTIKYQFMGDSTVGAVVTGIIGSASFAAGATIPRVTLADSLTAVATGGIVTGSFAAGTTLPRVTLTDTVTTYTGNTPQTGNCYPEVTHASYGLSKLVRSTTPANTLDVAATGEAGLDFANIKAATGATTLTNITVPTVTAVTNDVGITQVAADKAWGTTTRALTDKAGFALSSAGIQAIWDALTSALTTAGSVGKKLKDWALGTDNRALISADVHGAGVTVAGVTAAVTAGTVNDKTGYILASSEHTAITGDVLNATATSYNTAGTIGQKINAAASAGDPWSTDISSGYTGSQAGNIVFTKLDATVSSRSTYTGVDTPGTSTLLSRIPGTVQPQTGDAYARLGAAGAGLTALGDTRLANLDAAISTRLATAGYTVPPTVASIVAGTWDEPQSGHTVSGSFGARVDAAISTRLATAGYTVPPTAGANATAVWTEAIPGSFAAGSAGAKLNSASSSADPWATALPGAYGSGTAGNILGNRLDTTVGSRADAASYTPTRAIKLDNLDAAISTRSAPGTAQTIDQTTVLPVTPTAGTIGEALKFVDTRLDVTVGSRLATASYTTPPTAAQNATAFWTDTTSGDFTVNGSPGKVLITNLDVTVGSRLATTSYTTPPTAQANATAVLSEALPGSFGAGTVGAKIEAAGNAGDPWATTLPGAYGAGTAGSIIGNRVDTTISSRLPTTSYTAAPTAAQNAAATWAEAIPGAYGAGTAGLILGNRLDTTISSRLATTGYTVPPTAAANATAVWTEAIPGVYGAGTAAAKLNAAGVAGDPWATALPGVYASGTAGNLLGNRLDAAVSSRSTYAGGAVASVTAPVTVSTLSGVTFPTNFSAMVISSGGLVAMDTTRTFTVRNQDAVTTPTIADAMQGAWSEAFGRENTASTSYVKKMPDNSAAARTFVLDSATAPTSRS